METLFLTSMLVGVMGIVVGVFYSCWKANRDRESWFLTFFLTCMGMLCALTLPLANLYGTEAAIASLPLLATFIPTAVYLLAIGITYYVFKTGRE